MQIVHLVIVELANHSLQNLGKGVLTLTKKLLIGRTKILFALTTIILLVDGDCQGDGYVTIIVVNANKILVLPIRRVVVKVNTPLPRFCRD